VSTGNLTFHQWIVTTYPAIVHSYEEFDDTHPFEAIKLVGAISDPAHFNKEAHGKLTAVVRYHMPYTDSDFSPTALCIALGSDVAVNTILGWPTITDFQIALRLVPPCSFFSSVLNHTFEYSQSEATSGLPTGVEFDPDLDFVRSVEPALPAKSTPPPSHRSASANSIISPPSNQVRSLEPALPAKSTPPPSHRSASANSVISPPSNPVRSVEPAPPAKSTPPPSSRSAPTYTTASPPSSPGPFDPSRQMREMCRQMNAHIAALDTASIPVTAPPS
jgi:hypothetical protein